MISYRMSRRDYLSAPSMPKTRNSCSFVRASRIWPPAYRARRSANRGDTRQDRGEGAIYPASNAHPKLQAGALARTIPLEAFQRRIPENAVVIYLVRNGNDILGWTIARQFIEPVRIEGGYERAISLAERYREAIGAFGGVAAVSRQLAAMLKPFENYYRAKQSVVFIVDGDLEQVPFEIAGEKTMLDETHRVMYCSSILSALRDYDPIRPGLSLVGGAGTALYHDLERSPSAVRHRVDARTVLESGPGISWPRSCSTPSRERFPLEACRWRCRETVFATLPAFRRGVRGDGIFGVRAVRGTCERGALVLNDAAVHDVNNAVFVDIYYREIAAGADITSAFERAKQGVRSKRQFSHPAYWAGIRLYLNGLDEGR